MDKTKELIELLNKHPDRELIFMYPNEGSDYSHTLGHPTKIIVDEYLSDINIDRVWLRYEDEDEMFNHYADNIFEDLYPNEPHANAEQSMIIDEKTREYIAGLEWKKCICVYIQP